MRKWCWFKETLIKLKMYVHSEGKYLLTSILTCFFIICSSYLFPPLNLLSVSQSYPLNDISCNLASKEISQLWIRILLELVSGAKEPRNNTEVLHAWNFISQKLEEDTESQKVTGSCITLDCITFPIIDFEVITL